MAKHLVYYAKERQQYPEASAIEVSPEVAALVLPKIFAHFGAPAIKMSVNPRARNWSWYKAGGGLMTPRGRRSFRTQEIVIAKTMMNWRVLAHEVGHAIHAWDYDRRYNEARKEFKTIRRERWHGQEHRDWMAKIVNYLKATGVIPESITKKFSPQDPDLQKKVACAVDLVEGDVKTWNEYMRRECLASLAPTSLCPRCLLERTREQFGVRIIRKSAQGRAIKVVKQSYCRDCR